MRGCNIFKMVEKNKQTNKQNQFKVLKKFALAKLEEFFEGFLKGNSSFIFLLKPI